MVGLLLAVRAVPSILLGALGGAIADKYNRRYVLAIDKILTAFTSLAVAILITTGTLEWWHLFIIGVVSGVFYAFSEPAIFAMLGEFAPYKWLTQANSLRSLTLQLGEAIGPAAAGFIISGLGAQYVYWIVSAIYVLLVVFILRIPIGISRAVANSSKRSIWLQLREGLGFVIKNGALRWVAGIVLINNFTGVAIFPILPKFTVENLELGASAYGIMSGTIGAGLIVGSLLVLKFGLPSSRSLTIVLTGAVWDSLMVVFGFQSSLFLSVGILFFMGVVGSIWFTAAATVFHEQAPKAIHASALSVFVVATQFFSLGWLFGGALAELTSIQITLIISALASTPVAIAAWLFSRAFRRI